MPPYPTYTVSYRGSMPAAMWASQNPVLAQFERGRETDTGKEKEGPGAWNDLGYLNPSGAATVPVKATGAEVNTGTDDAKFITAKAIEDSDYAKTAAITSAVNAAVSALLDGAPGALDTLNELAAALADDAAFSTTVTNALALRPTNAAGENAIPKSDDEGNLVASSLTDTGTAITSTTRNFQTGDNATTALNYLRFQREATGQAFDVFLNSDDENSHCDIHAVATNAGTGLLIETQNAVMVFEEAPGEIKFNANSLLANPAVILMPNLPTSNPNVAGQLYTTAGALMVSAG